MVQNFPSFPAARIVTVLALLVMPLAATAGTVKSRDGWVAIDTHQTFSALVGRLDAAVGAENMRVVTSASASEGARAAGVAIPGNRVVGVFRNDFARRMLDASVSSGIEAPVRFYVTENPDGSATLSYRKPTAIFASYADEGGDRLAALARELDDIFARIADRATKDN